MDEESNKRLGALIERLADGDASALKEIALLMERLLRAIGNIYYKHNADIEDAIQNLYIKLYDNARKFRENTNASAWIIKVFENSIKSDLRCQRIEREFLKEKELNFRPNNDRMDENYIENYLFLREIFDKLTCDERHLILYYHWCKCSVREVAEIMHKPKSTIDRKLKKLQEKVKKFFDKWDK